MKRDSLSIAIMIHRSFLVLLVTLMMTLTGCAGLSAALPTIDSAVVSTSLALQVIETAVHAFEATHAVSDADRAEYDRLLAAATQSLQKGTEIVTDLHDIDQSQYDAAFADFKKDYDELHAFVVGHGITPIGEGGIGVSSKPADFPPPRVLSFRVKS